VSLVICLAIWVVSCPPSWKEIYLEVRTLVNNIVSLFTEKIEIFLSLGCEANLCSWSLGSSHGWILDIAHVCRECLGKKWFVCENPLRRWEPFGGFWRSSLNFFIKGVKYLKWFVNEKEKDEVYLGGAISFAWVNIIVLTAWDEIMKPFLLC